MEKPHGITNVNSTETSGEARIPRVSGEKGENYKKPTSKAENKSTERKCNKRNVLYVNICTLCNPGVGEENKRRKLTPPTHPHPPFMWVKRPGCCINMEKSTGEDTTPRQRTPIYIKTTKFTMVVRESPPSS